MLGVEIGEEFEIVFPLNCCCHATAMLTNEGAKVIDADVFDIHNFKSYLLTHLLNGAYSIRHKPWKPKVDERFYIVTVDGSVMYKYWDDCSNHINYYRLGNFYRTYAEAEANCDKWVAFYKCDKVLEV